MCAHLIEIEKIGKGVVARVVFDLSWSGHTAFLLQGGRGDLSEHYGAQRHTAGWKGAQGVCEVPEAAAR